MRWLKGDESEKSGNAFNLHTCIDSTVRIGEFTDPKNMRQTVQKERFMKSDSKL